MFTESFCQNFKMSVAVAAVVLFVCLASSVEGEPNTTTTTTATPATMATTPSHSNDSMTTSAAKVTTSKSNVTSMLMCYNETRPSNNTCMSSSGICYTTLNMSGGSLGHACKSSATTASVCSQSYAITTGTVAGRCEFCCTTNLCNRDRNSTVLRSACCGSAANQNQPGCSSGASRHVTMTSPVVIMVIYVIMLVGKLGNVPE